MNKFLVSISSYEYHGVDDESDGRSMRHFWVDPESGAVQLAVGELRPLLHQTSRTLQPGAAPNELWAAIYDPKARKTGVGIYNSRSLTFTPRVSVRKISFTSAHLWADAGAGRFYYVYKGHLLALPLPPKKAR